MIRKNAVGSMADSNKRSCSSSLVLEKRHQKEIASRELEFIGIGSLGKKLSIEGSSLRGDENFEKGLRDIFMVFLTLEKSEHFVSSRKY